MNRPSTCIAAAFLLAATGAAPAAADQNHWTGYLSHPVYANDSHGSRFWNHTYYTLSCRFWPVESGWYHDGIYVEAGGDGSYGDDFPLADCPAYALVARDDSGNAFCIGDGLDDVTSYDHVDLWFFMNAPSNSYGHNTGSLRIAYDCWAIQ
jgi:hypothetical protein